MSKFSICIPTHDRGENGPKWMRELLNSIKKQTFKDFDIVVTDQSKNDLILKAGGLRESAATGYVEIVRRKKNIGLDNPNLINSKWNVYNLNRIKLIRFFKEIKKQFTIKIN